MISKSVFREKKSAFRFQKLGVYALGFLGLNAVFLTQAAAQSVNLGSAILNASGGSSTSPIVFNVGNTSSSAISGTSGYIISEGQFNVIRWRVKDGTGTFTVPFADAGGNVIPVTVDITDPGSNDGYIDFATYPTGQNNLPMPVGVTSLEHVDFIINDGPPPPADGAKLYDRYWFINADSYTTQPTAMINLSYVNSLMSGDLVSGVTPMSAQFHNGTGWIIDQMGVDDLSGVVAGIPVSDGAFFSTFALVQNGFPLPITLLSFNAVWANETQSQARVFWSTASEKNNDYFIVERTANGLDWTEIQKVDGAGNSVHVLNYQIFDNRPLNGVSYYRLKQVDFDGTVTYSNVVSLNKDQMNPSIAVYPNPATNDFNIYFSNFASDVVNVSIMDNSGRTVHQFNPNVLNNPEQQINARNFQSGLYHIQVSSADQVFTEKIVIRN